MDGNTLFRSKRKKNVESENQKSFQEVFYGREQNARRRLCQQEIEDLEKKSRSNTGLPSNPNHIIPYFNHPYGTKKRILEKSNDNDGLFKPLRVRFFTDAMHQHKTESNKFAIEFVETEILQKAADFWSSALSVVPVDGRLRINSYDLYNKMYCGDPEFSLVPPSHIEEGVIDADVIWYVSATPSNRLCGASTLAVAVACNFDQFDRPTAGAINFCLDQIKIDSNGGQPSDAVKQDNVDVAVHEAAHILGMSSNAFRYFYDSDTGKPRTSRPFKTQTVTCVDGTTRTEILPSENTVS